MCMSKVFMNNTGNREMIMEDVARIEAEGRGFWLIDLFGGKKFVEGTVKIIDFLDEHFIELEK